MSLSPDDSEPASRQVASAIRGEISAGDLAPGAKIPSVRKLSERFGVAVMTAQSAVEILRSEGLIYTSPGRGSFVRSGPPRTKRRPGRQSSSRLRSISGRCRPPSRILRGALLSLRKRPINSRLDQCIYPPAQVGDLLGKTSQRLCNCGQFVWCHFADCLSFR